MNRRARWEPLGVILIVISIILSLLGFLFIYTRNLLLFVATIIPALALLFIGLILTSDKRRRLQRGRLQDDYRRTLRDHWGIIIMVIGACVVISGLMLSLYIGLLYMLVMVVIGAAILVIGIYLDSKVRVRYQRKLPPDDEPRIVVSDLPSILDYARPKKADVKTDDIEPLSTYENLAVPYGNFWIKFGYLTRAFAKYLGLGLVFTIGFAVIQILTTVDFIRGLLYSFVALLLMVPLFVIFILWIILNSYIFRDRAHLFPEGHPYQDKVLWNVKPGSMVCQKGPARHSTLMDLEISHQIPRSWRGRRIGLILPYPLNFYGANEFLNQFYIPAPSDLEEGGILRIYRLGFRFDSDFSDVYFRVHYISLFRYRVLMILWFVIIAMLMIWFLFFIFGPLVLYFATLFGVVV